MAYIEINRDRCKGCLYCVTSCPQGLIRRDSVMNALGVLPVVFDSARADACSACQCCAVMCPECAIAVSAGTLRGGTKRARAKKKKAPQKRKK
mgnify:CR=1 FL=1